MFYKMFEHLCKSRNIAKTKVLNEIGLSTGNLKKWSDGGTVNSDIIIKIAEFFEVSTDYILLGKEGDKNLNENEKELLGLFRKLESNKQLKFIGKAEMIIESLLEENNKTKSS